MQNRHRGGHEYRVFGANQVTGEDVEVIVLAYDEADAGRTANRQGVFANHCVPVAGAGTLARAIADDAVARALLGRFPDIGYRLGRLNPEDQAYLLDLSAQRAGISADDASHIANLIRSNRHLTVA